MEKLRLVRALATGAAAAALSTLTLWFVALLVGDDKLTIDATGLDLALSFLALAALVFLVALIVALIAETLVALPLFLLLRNLGRHRVGPYLVGGLIASASAYIAIKGVELPPRPFVALAYLLPGLVGAYAFRRVVGWSADKGQRHA